MEGIGLPVLAVPNCSSTITDSQFLCITIEEVENAVGYMILLENGTREVVVNSAGTYYFPSPGESSRDFQVKALGDGVNYTNSSWTDLVRKSSDFAAATNDVTPTAPTLGVKENEGTLQVTVPEIEGAGRYVVEVSTDESFSNVVRAESTESGDIMIEGLDIRTTYYVRTCAMNMDASGEPTNYTNWSELVNVEVGPIGTLAAPGLTAEADGYSFTGAFTAVENAVEYVLSYSTDSTFQENVESITLTPEEIANGFSIDGAAYQFQIQLTPIDTTLENSPLSKVAKLFRVK